VLAAPSVKKSWPPLTELPDALMMKTGLLWKSKNSSRICFVMALKAFDAQVKVASKAVLPGRRILKQLFVRSATCPTVQDAAAAGLQMETMSVRTWWHRDRGKKTESSNFAQGAFIPRSYSQVATSSDVP